MGRYDFFLKVFAVFVVGLVSLGFTIVLWPTNGKVSPPLSLAAIIRSLNNEEPIIAKELPPPPPPYIPPDIIKAIYITSTTALLTRRMETIKKLIADTELNAVVINVNDISKDIMSRPEFLEVVKSLNTDGIHTVARIVVFQNEPLIDARPELALKTGGGSIWRDGGGHRWLDPSSEEVWKEILKTSEQAVAIGFRELNYDYIRFPSDGKVASAVYPYWDKEKPRETVINSFADYLKSNLKTRHPDLILSADIFAHTLLVKDDALIGQKFTDIVDYFDVIAPMIYPSHYRAGNFGFVNPAAHPYGVVFGTLEKGKAQLMELKKDGVVIRPWLQDFNMGAVYSADMVKQEMKAVEDAGYESGWMLWNPRNVYTVGALANEK